MIWTDVFQGVIVLGVLLTVTILASNELGGFTRVWEINMNGSRIDFTQ